MEELTTQEETGQLIKIKHIFQNIYNIRAVTMQLTIIFVIH